MNSAPITASQKSHSSPLWTFAPIWAVLAFCLFYAALPYLPFQRDLLIRYCSSHPLEYITMGMFFLGITTLIVRRLELGQQKTGLKQIRGILDETRESGQSVRDIASALSHKWSQTSDAVQHSWAGNRLREALDFFGEMGSSQQLESSLQHCADLDHDRAQQRLGFINTICWAVPIVGFLGTVMGITLAIANVTPDQLSESLSEVTGGLAVAFDTTALSLTLSLLLVFATFLTRSFQDELLTQIDERINRQLVLLLQEEAGSSIQGHHAEVSANLVDASSRIVTEATLLWREKMDRLQTQMVTTLQSEQSRFAEQLHAGVSDNLAAQNQHLEALRADERAAGQQMTEQLVTAMSQWEQSLQQTSLQLTSQSEQISQHTELLLQVINKQQQLSEYNQQVQQSFETHRITETLDQTLNSLTACIQLLNARVNSSQKAA